MKFAAKMLKPIVLTSTILTAGAFAADMTVYKSPYCGCCEKWVEKMVQAGFAVTSVNSDNMATIKHQYGVPRNLQSCHTATIDGYVIEGHVPAADIKRLLLEKQKLQGLATPGMPQSAPGMDVPGTSDHYQVIAFSSASAPFVYNEYNSK